MAGRTSIAEVILGGEFFGLFQLTPMIFGNVIHQEPPSIAGLLMIAMDRCRLLDLFHREIDAVLGLLHVVGERIGFFGHQIELDIEVVDFMLGQAAPERLPIELVLALLSVLMMLIQPSLGRGDRRLCLIEAKPGLAKDGGSTVLALAPAGEKLLEFG